MPLGPHKWLHRAAVQRREVVTAGKAGLWFIDRGGRSRDHRRDVPDTGDEDESDTVAPNLLRLMIG